MNNPKITVAIPIYNVEKYIERCARSLFEQTLQDIEFIFIDDCSPDNSVKILKDVLKDYPKRQEQTKIISLTKNGGLGNARTIGVKAATSEYIIHCDSDDWVDNDLYEKMYNAAIKDNADIVICDCIEEYKNKSILNSNPNFSQDPKEVIANAYKYIFWGSLCNKLIKRNLYIDNNIYSYPNISMAEDLGVTCRLFVLANKLTQIRDSNYHYFRANEKSITANKYSDTTINQMLEVSKLLRDYLLKIDNQRYEIYANFLCYSSRLQIIRGKFSDLSLYKMTYPETDKYIKYFKYSAFPTKARFRFWLVKYKMSFLSIILYKIVMLKSKFFS